MSGPILCSDAYGVRTITLSYPERLNAIDLQMIEELQHAVQTAQQDDAVRVILLTGAGRSFCAGDDVTAQSDICEAGEAALRDQLARLQDISEQIVLGDKLCLAVVRGWAVGAGFSWMLNCDFRLWSDNAGGFLPEVGFGTFVTGGATLLLPRIISAQLARDMLFLGTRLKADDALGAGLVHAIYPDDQLDAQAEQFARRLAELPITAARRMKQALMHSEAAAFRDALSHETEACVATTLDPETLARMRTAIAKD